MDKELITFNDDDIVYHVDEGQGLVDPDVQSPEDWFVKPDLEAEAAKQLQDEQDHLRLLADIDSCIASTSLPAVQRTNIPLKQPSASPVVQRTNIPLTQPSDSPKPPFVATPVEPPQVLAMEEDWDTQPPHPSILPRPPPLSSPKVRSEVHVVPVKLVQNVSEATAPSLTPILSRLGPPVTSSVKSRLGSSASTSSRGTNIPSRPWIEKSQVTPAEWDAELSRKSQQLKLRTESLLATLPHVPHQVARKHRQQDYDGNLNLYNNDSDDENDFEDENGNVYKGSSSRKVRLVRAQADHMKIYHQEKVSREYAEWSAITRKPQLMETLKLKNAKNRISEKSGYCVKDPPTQDYHFFKLGDTEADNHPAVQRLVKEVKATKFMSFDTEGKGLADPRTGLKNRIFVAYSSPKSATVLLFHCAKDTPTSIRDLLQDFTVAKLQSAVAGDVLLLKGVGVDVRGVVDSGCLFLMLQPMPASKKFGAGGQINYIFKQGHQPYHFFKFNKEFESMKLSTKAIQHVLQDVLTPYATLFQVTVEEAERHGLHEDDDVAPIMNQALEICYSKSPLDTRAKTLREKQDYWFPSITESEFDLNSGDRCQMIRRARCTLVEGHIFPRTETTLEEKIKAATDIWSRFDLPSQKHFKGSNYWMEMSKLCQNCGSKYHKMDKCPLEFTICHFKHNKLVHPPHSILLCPDLHSYCSECKYRGHLKAEHLGSGLQVSPWKSRQNFMNFAHMGLFTSIPYLHRFKPVRDFHWVASFGASKLSRHPGELWTYFGVEEQIPADLIDIRKPEREMAFRNLSSNGSTYERMSISRNLQRRN
jgi:hypothetical protein